MRTRIKFCGCTNVDDAAAAVACGVDAVGIIFAPASPRRVDRARAAEIAAVIPPFVARVAVFVDPSLDDIAAAGALGFLPQLCGDESPEFCASAQAAVPAGRYVKVLHVEPDATRERVVADAVRWQAYDGLWMFDTALSGMRGGTGRRFPWDRAREVAGSRPFAVSGGLDAANVGDCIRAVRPYAVDVRSGIETDGVKDVHKMRAFVRAVKEADEES